MSRCLLAVCLLCLLPTTLPAQGKTLHARKIDLPILIDGVVDPVWNAADSVSDYFQLNPYYDKPPVHRTVAKVLTGDDALYCLMLCYEDRKDIQTITGLLDQSDGEVVSIMLDTFNDKKSAYKFALAASGVKSDARLLDDGRNRDYSWDGIWAGATKVYDWGFVAEFKIPYRSIRYDASAQSWGLDFDRWIGQSKEDLYWNVYEQNAGQRISQFGRLIFDNFRPSLRGLNLEVYPVGIAKATYLSGSKYKVDPNAGIDIFYNPSEKLTFQLTANPDFAQIEADPFAFNISRYETHFDERRPFFTEGAEVFTASGKDHSTGFYSPLELLYTRRIGKLLPDGSGVPLSVGTKAFSRVGGWEYGAFFAQTEQTDYRSGGLPQEESRASFMAARVKSTLFENSSIGLLYAGKASAGRFDGVLDLDGAFRTPDWQLSYQLARSIEDGRGDFAGSAGFISISKTWLSFVRLRAIGNGFNVNEVGFVPWIGTTESAFITGPIWRPATGAVSQILFFAGAEVNYKDAELYIDRSAILGYNMQFRDNWGFEIDFSAGRSKDQGIIYNAFEVDLSNFYQISPRWDAQLNGNWGRGYNFQRNYLAFFTFLNTQVDYKPWNTLQVGTSYGMYIEGNPQGSVEDITYNARPYLSLTPVNDLNLRVYVDNTFATATDKLEGVLLGFLFSYNFRPKSWIYLAYNEAHDRSQQFDALGSPLPLRMHLVDRVAVFKVKYLYYL